jgi:hypothetical protein
MYANMCINEYICVYMYANIYMTALSWMLHDAIGNSSYMSVY